MVPKNPVAPFFSIITCTRNSAKFIRKCLNSVKSQTFKDFEHIIVDGESTDKTTTILKEHGYKFVSLPAKGIANAMNAGIRVAHGKYIYFLNSDDSLYNREVLQNIHDYLINHSGLDWVFGNIHETDGKKTIGFPPIRKIFQGKHPNILKFYNYIPHQATFVKRSVFEKYGEFDESLKSMMDPEYWLRISGSTAWGYMPVVVANYLVRPDSQSESISNATSNTTEYQAVQAKYLHFIELIIARYINKVLR
ncbi:glycosyltransferase [Candidatus Woesebacteria bacterium]|nr:glycosyltransferase [Candidatus Woesebacteria bacterium]